MATDDRTQIEEDAQILSRACREVRSNPDRFSLGLAFIEERLSIESRRQELRTIFDEAGSPDAPPEVVALFRDKIESAGNPMVRIRLLKNWVYERNFAMGGLEAQVVMLVAAWLYDDEPDWSIGLPAVLDRWVVEAQDPEDQRDPTVRLQSQQGVLRMLRYELVHSTEYRRQMAHVARVAWERLASKPDNLPRRTTPKQLDFSGVPPLETYEIVFMRVLVEQDPMVWFSSEEWCDLYGKYRENTMPHAPAESSLRARIVPRLKLWGLESERRGYRFPSGCLARAYLEASR